MKEKVILCAAVIALSACASVASTSFKLEDRDQMLSESRCAVNFKRSNKFIEYFPPVYSQKTLMLYSKHESIRAYDLRGDLFYYGCDSAGLQPDKAEAAKWYLFTANLHVPEAQFKLGKMMAEGDGIPKNETAGMEWLVSAALEQDSNARRYLEQKGVDVPRTSGPNTYERITDYNRQIAKQQNAQFWSDLGGVVILAAATYAVVYASQAPSYSSGRQPSITHQPTIYRYKPTWCSSSIMATAYSGIVTGTVTTFCN